MWKHALDKPLAYRTSTARRALTRLYQMQTMPVSDFYALIDCFASHNPQRKWMLDAIRDGVLESDDAEHDAALRNGKSLPDRRGKRKITVRLTESVKADIEKFLDRSIEEIGRALKKERA